ncbi:hypothetical protein K7X08_018055 [Anisodus acutangulus]|uniref:Uncharacterized protein n=1 Tax=Anisodus acutangulus TaxID=402998 RepID=A0A9Q1LVB2_9SOLA|nr:hypothetical protein K7X08_018055 [Anisodus acutangulus]
MGRKCSKIAKPDDEADVGPSKKRKKSIARSDNEDNAGSRKKKKVLVYRKNKLHSQSDLEILSYSVPHILNWTVKNRLIYKGLKTEIFNYLNRDQLVLSNIEPSCVEKTVLQ